MTIGLSPRVRGNRPAYPLVSSLLGSIPACTGEPVCHCVTPCGVGVYPRVYGGTTSRNSRPRSSIGLSPRVRGNRSEASKGLPRRRSIPACTGEPVSSCVGRWRCWVYPRVYGGTMSSTEKAGSAQGLSPRVRGNPGKRLNPPTKTRSIPACTGEPTFTSDASIMPKVYPRVYGGTEFQAQVVDLAKGLSPRVRGNRPSTPPRAPLLRSIPACTGEPLSFLPA